MGSDPSVGPTIYVALVGGRAALPWRVFQSVARASYLRGVQRQFAVCIATSKAPAMERLQHKATASERAPVCTVIPHVLLPAPRDEGYVLFLGGWGRAKRTQRSEDNRNRSAR